MPLREQRGIPGTIRVDNGPGPSSKALAQWACLNGVESDFIRPGKPTEDGLVQTFNGGVRQECLNESWVLSLEDSRGKVEAWRQHYNEVRPHTRLGNQTPLEYVKSVAMAPQV